MEIKELHIKNFGKFSDEHVLLHPGVHIFYGENEYGKSTIYAFIKAMLFGLERGRGRAALNDEFSRYEPWENPNYFAGVMWFTSGGKNFRLERQFDRYAKGGSLICEDDGEELSLEDGDLEMLLGGITREHFENTAAIGQLTAKPGQGLAEELKNYAANYYETGSSTVNLNGAVESLKSRRKALEHELHEQKHLREIKINEIYRKMDYVSTDLKKLKSEIEENQKKLNSLNRDFEQCAIKTPDNIEDNEQEQKQKKVTHEDGDISGKSMMKLGISGVFVGLLGLAWSILGASLSGFTGTNTVSGVSVFAWIFLIIGVVLLIAGTGRLYKSRKSEKIKNHTANSETESFNQAVPDSQDAADTNCQKMEIRHQKLEWERQRLYSEWKEKQVEHQNLQEQLEESTVIDEKSRGIERTNQALLLAEEKLLKTSREIVQSFGGILNQKASRILERITDRRYTDLLIDEKLDMVLFKDGRRIPVERVSRGTIEQVYFALRMASAELLCEEPMPIIIDDAFAYYDEKRLKSALKWLSEQQRQVIIFTCQKREKEIVKQF